MSERFVSSSLVGFKSDVKRLRSLLGKDKLSSTRTYEVAARVCGFQSWYELNQVLKLRTPPQTIWDEDLDELELVRRREFQLSVLTTEADVAELEAERILGVVQLSSRARYQAAIPSTNAHMNARVDQFMEEDVERKERAAPSVTYRKRRISVSRAVK